MKRKRATWCLTAALLLAQAVGSASAAPSGASAAAFDTYVTPYVESRNFTGVVLVARGTDVLFEKAYGMAEAEEGRANTLRTPFHIASMSMQFTAAAVMRLVEEGTLDLDATVDRFGIDVPNGKSITVRMLLEERSGLPDINTLPGYDKVLASHQTPRSLIGIIRDEPPRFAPGLPSQGEEHSAYNLLAWIIEKKTDLSFAYAERSLVFVPLGMAQSGVDDDQPAPGGSAVGYEPAGVRDLRPAAHIHWSAKTGNGSAYATAGDELIWVNAAFHGGFLSPSSREIVLDNRHSNVGYGWFKSVSKQFRVPVYYMNGRAPGFGSFAIHIPSSDLTVVVLSNIYSALSTTIGLDLAAIATGAAYKPVRLRATPLPPEEADGLAGSYLFGSDFYQRNATLRLVSDRGDQFLVWPDGSTTALIPTERDSFIDRSYWVPVSFRRKADNSVDQIVYGTFVGNSIAGSASNGEVIRGPN